MFLASFPAGPWAANCYLAAASPGGTCVVIDPGMDAGEGIRTLCREHDVRPEAVLLTHGHIDHIASAAALVGEYDVPCLIHADDRHLLSDPGAGLSRESGELIRAMFGSGRLSEPARLELVGHADSLSLAGIDFQVVHAPGHTRGSVLYRAAYHADPAVTEVVFTGDVVFAGSIGRTDLPGGDAEVMSHTLITRVLTLPDTAVILPGHGELTSMAHERVANPYLQPSFLRSR